MSSMFYHDFLSFRTCTTENTPNTISLNYLHTLMKSANFLSVLSNFCGARKWRETNYANQHDRFRSDTDRLLSTWFWLKESETTVCLKTFEKKIGLYCNVRLLLPQSFHTWKHTKMARPLIAGWTYKAIISSKQNLLEATCWERTVACYLVKFYTVHMIAAKLAIRTLHFVTIFSTELKYDEKKITQLTNWCWQFPDLFLSKDYFSSQF